MCPMALKSRYDTRMTLYQVDLAGSTHIPMFTPLDMLMDGEVVTNNKSHVMCLKMSIIGGL